MVHGRYDVSGPLDIAWQLTKAWPEGKLAVIGDAGHSGGGMTSVLVEYLDRVASHS
jgi:proline iminopeptidase